MTRRFLSIVTILCLAAIPAIAQTRPFNAAGVTAGHEHLAGTDAAAHNAFWTALGAVPAQLGTGTQILKLPGVFIMFQNAGGRGGRGGNAPAAGAAPAAPPAAPGPSEGSSVEHLAFKVKSLKDTLAKLDAAGTKPAGRRALEPGQGEVGGLLCAIRQIGGGELLFRETLGQLQVGLVR